MRRILTIIFCFISYVSLAQPGVSVPGNGSPRYSFNRLTYRYYGGSMHLFLDKDSASLLYSPILTVTNTGSTAATISGSTLNIPNLLGIDNIWTGSQVIRRSVNDATSLLTIDQNNPSATGTLLSGTLQGAERIRISRFGSVTSIQENIGTFPGLAFSASNTQAATSGSPVQIAPFYQLLSNGWNPTLAISNQMVARIDLLPVSANPVTSQLRFGFLTDAGTPTFPVTIDNSGNIATTSINVYSTGGYAQLVRNSTSGRFETISGTPIDNILSKTADYTIVSGDFAAGKKTTLDLYVDATAANTTITLPSASTFSGYTIYVTKTDAGANTVTVNTVLGNSTLTSQYQVRQFNSNGTAWYNH